MSVHAQDLLRRNKSPKAFITHRLGKYTDAKANVMSAVLTTAIREHDTHISDLMRLEHGKHQTITHAT